MDALNLIDELDTHKPKRFLAPVLDADRVRIHVLLDSIPYRFGVRHNEPGWWMLKPVSKSKAKVDSPVNSMMDVMNYLQGLPRFLVIALFRVRASTWLVVPFSSADAAQRGWPNGEPRQLHLVRHRIEPFDVLEARQLGNTLIYHLRSSAYGVSRITMAMRQNLLTEPSSWPDIPGMRSAWFILQEHIKEQRRQRRQEAVAKRKASIEEQLRWHLAFMGAELNTWHEAGNSYRVTWTHGGQSYSMDVARSGFIESAGVCLDGTAGRHNLSAIVNVMEEHRRLGRTY